MQLRTLERCSDPEPACQEQESQICSAVDAQITRLGWKLGGYRCLGSYRLTLSLPEAATLLNLLPREEAAVQAALCWGLRAVLQTLQRPGQHHGSALPPLYYSAPLSPTLLNDKAVAVNFIRERAG